MISEESDLTHAVGLTYYISFGHIFILLDRDVGKGAKSKEEQSSRKAMMVMKVRV